MLECFEIDDSKPSIPITIIPSGDYAAWYETQDEFTQNWLKSSKFSAESDGFNCIPDSNGNLHHVICVLLDVNNFWGVGALSTVLPHGLYHFPHQENVTNFALAWGLGAYQFTRYKTAKKTPAQLKMSQPDVASIVEATYFVRDLINTPTDDMGPSQLAATVAKLSESYHAEFSQIIGEDLLKFNFPSIHIVGRASDDAPRLLDLRWGDKTHPAVTLVGKGVCFDTGGLDLKSSAYMLLMKKDMGGAANVLGLAKLIMENNLPIRLRILIPAVENSVSGNAYRPGDIVKTRQGLTVEIGNTDAEGRVILADALAEAASENPDLIIDLATLTGAARIALGTDLPALFSNDDELAESLLKHGTAQNDPMWRLPLFSGYREALNSPIADLNNATSDGYAGAITAALFLKEFVPDHISWAHIDMMAWNLKSRAGRPQGGEAMAIRGIFSYLQKQYMTNK